MEKKIIMEFFRVTKLKVKVSRLDTYYYINPICKLEIPTKSIQINEINFFVMFILK
jgi:hypothetical protein